jgi:hypothetical protein
MGKTPFLTSRRQLMRRRKLFGILALVLALSVLGTACGGSKTPTTAKSPTTAAQPEPSSDTGAATLRAGLTGLLTEHVYLAALATDAALRGDDAGFKAYADALNGPANSNSSDLAAAITSAYGEDTGKAFDGLWRSQGHIPAFVAYTTAVAKKDKAGQDKAVADLLAYAKTFGETMHKVNVNLPADAVEEGVKMHITTLKAVVDAQAAKDAPKVYSALREAYGHMAEFAATLAGATVAKFPDKFDGKADSPASDLRAGLTSLLREHVFLAASATGAALRGDDAGFNAAAEALNGQANCNTADVVAAVTSVYGAGTGKAFDGLWRSQGHIPAVVAYTTAVARKDKAGQDKAVADLLAYAKTFGETMHKVNENLPADAVEEAIRMHVTTLKAVVDAQAAKDATKAASALREAVQHMSGTADVIAAATVKKFPSKF